MHVKKNEINLYMMTWRDLQHRKIYTFYRTICLFTYAGERPVGHLTT